MKGEKGGGEGGRGRGAPEDNYPFWFCGHDFDDVVQGSQLYKRFKSSRGGRDGEGGDGLILCSREAGREDIII